MRMDLLVGPAPPGPLPGTLRDAGKGARALAHRRQPKALAATGIEGAQWLACPLTRKFEAQSWPCLGGTGREAGRMNGRAVPDALTATDRIGRLFATGQVTER